MNQRINQTVIEAEKAFWEMIAKMYPEIKTGDLSPETTINLHNTMQSAVEEWVKNNSNQPNYFFNDSISVLDVDARNIDFVDEMFNHQLISYKDLSLNEHIVNVFEEEHFNEEPFSDKLRAFMKEGRKACEAAGPNFCYVRLRYV